MNKTILGLDLGTNSIGWALLQRDFINKTGVILGAGSRIIPMSQDILGVFDSGQSYSLTAERTGFRSTRRLRERHLLRRERLHRVLNILQFLPEHYSSEIDFDSNFGQFKTNREPKIAYKFNPNEKKYDFIFLKSFEEMLSDFKKSQPELVNDNKKIPYDWTIYYLRKKALTQKIDKEELAWLILHFNQKRGYYQLRGEDEEENKNKSEAFYELKVVEVQEADKGKNGIWYNVVLENGWIYKRDSKIPLFDWVGKTKEFIVTTELNEDGTIKTDKEGKEKRSFRAPKEDDWNLLKKKTEFDIDNSRKTVGTYIYEKLLQQPDQKIKGKLVRTIERKYYKEELLVILNKQKEFHPELQDKNLYNSCLEELYSNNEAYRANNSQKDFTYLFLEDIIFYQRPLKSKTALISNCNFEVRCYITNENLINTKPLKCIAKSHPLYQEFRLLQWIKNLKIIERETEQDVTNQYLQGQDDLENLYLWLNDKKDIDQKKLLKYFKLNEKIFRWNYVEDKIYPCNETRAQFLTRIEKAGISPEFLNDEIEESLWHILYSIQDKIEIEKALKKFAERYELQPSFVEQFKKYPRIEREYGAYSAKAIKKLLPLMRFGRKWNIEAIDINTKDRIDKIINAEYDEKIKDKVREKAIHLNQIHDFQNLPLWLASYIVYNKHSEDGESKFWKTVKHIDFIKQHSLRNPIVEQVINETLRVVKDIWLTYGNGKENFFDEIHVELGREMKNNAADRKQITEQNTTNENTNLRIKALLSEFIHHKEIENVRPFSPSQQEILKLFEEGILSGKSEKEIPEDILKISKSAQPTKSEMLRYKLWLEQGYISPYTGNIIPLNKLFTPAYEIEHIIPQSRFYDDSFNNKVICEAEVNKLKDNQLGLEFIKNHHGEIVSKGVQILEVESYIANVKKQFANNKSKLKKLLMDEIPDKFIERQLNDSRYISKVIKNLLSNIVREENEEETTSKNLVVGNGATTSVLRQDWGLNDIWNELISYRFIRLNKMTNSIHFGTVNENTNKFLPTIPLEYSKGFQKKRIDHRHHTLDAIVIACTTRDHVNFLHNLNALDKKKNKDQKSTERFDLRNKLCYKKYNDDTHKDYKWVFYKPWDSFTQETKNILSNTLVSFKQNTRVINKTVNYYYKWKEIDGKQKKVLVKQEKGDNWAIRKPMHKDTVSGQVTLRNIKTTSLSGALDNWEMIVDKPLRRQIKALIDKKYDKKSLQKYFKDRENKWNRKDISKVEVYYIDTENVASRVKLNDTFNTTKIETITDSGIKKILNKHLALYNEIKNNKIIEHPELAFSPEGIDELNKNMISLNEGKKHQPIYKVRTYEPKGNKFSIGEIGNKSKKFVEAAKGTNLFFGVYFDEKNNKRVYETIPLNIVIERQKQGLTAVPEVNNLGFHLIFYLSPNDLVYVPTNNEIENRSDFLCPTNEQIQRIYKAVSFTGNNAFFILNNIATSIVNKYEFSPLNKMEKTIDGIMIKERCWKLKVDRLGKIMMVIK